MSDFLAALLANYDLNGRVVCCENYGHGHINKTFLVTTDTGHRYILQGINNGVFKNVDGLMGNIEAVTEHLLKQTNNPRRVLHLVKTKWGKSYLHQDGAFWRIFRFVENSICLQAPETTEDFYQSAVAFGRFQQLLKDFPAHTLYETIPNFHNTADRYRIFKETLASDPLGRAASVQKEVDFILAREADAHTIVDLLDAGKLPLRVTHNDTKLNNVMLDADSRKALCVIDLDTVMPGSSLYDFGDAIRFGAATAAEDEKDLSKMEMRLDMFEAFTRGYLSACPDLTEEERDQMPMGAKLMTLECGVRFLTDYIDGDNYFSTSYEGQNLDRCRTQLKLVADMESKWEQMHAIVKSL